MKKPNVWSGSLWGSGLLLCVLFPLTDIAFGYGIPERISTVLTAESQGRQDGPSTLPSTKGHTEHEGSPVIGGGVRNPPDIGAAGTASSTPPVRTESPTDKPAILPDASTVPQDPSNGGSVPDAESQPLGQPDHFRKQKE